MARQTIELVTCDVCKEPGAKSYALAQVGDTPQAGGKVVDLCPEHSSPVDGLLKRGRGAVMTIEGGRVARSAPKPPAPRLNRKIYTEEELDALEEE